MGYFEARGYRPEVLFEDSHLRAELVPQISAIINVWSGFLMGEGYRRRLEQVLELVTRHRVDRVLADSRQLRALVADDSHWTDVVWAPRAVACGIRAMAVVLPRSVFAQLHVTRITQKLGEEQMLTAQFDELVDAQRWLESPEVSGQTMSMKGGAGREK
jgi:hypothetical protein